MSDLSAYIDFAVQLDLRGVTPVIVISDTGVYPGGVKPTITGIVSVIQPDTGERVGVFTAPDIVYSGSSLQPCSIVLRMTNAGTVQAGNYTVIYTINATGYLPTTLAKTFTFAYTQATATLTSSVNVFLPNLSVMDNTDYNVGGLTTGSIVRSWNVLMCAGTLIGTLDHIDLGYGGFYYDSNYIITFNGTVSYTSTVYSYLTVIDTLTVIEDLDVYTPPTQAELLNDITALKTALDASPLCDNEELIDDYSYAFVLWRHANARICAGEYDNVYTYYDEILTILANRQALIRAHSNIPIDAYVYTCETGSGATTAAIILYEVMIGSAEATALGIVAGATSIVNAEFANHKLEIVYESLPLPGIDKGDGSMFYTKAFFSNTINFSSPLADSAYIRISTLYQAASSGSGTYTSLDVIAQGTGVKYMTAAEYIILQQIIAAFTT